MKKPCNTGGFACMRCGGTAIYLSVMPMDLKGTLTCFYCGETVDGKMGISRNGERYHFAPYRARYVYEQKLP